MFKNSKAHIDSKANKTDSVFYFNANIYNDPTPPQSAKIARFSQSISSGSVVDLPENYYLAIVRFAISHMLIPLYQFRNNFYSVTITEVATGLSTQTFLDYADNGSYSQYGYTQPVFFYQQFMFMVNRALLTSHNARGNPGGLPPFIVYKDEKFTIYVPPAYFDPFAPPVNQVQFVISFNANLFQQLQFIECIFQGYNRPDGIDYTLDYYAYPESLNQIQLPQAPFIPATIYTYYEQERKALYLLNEVQSIVFTSTSINVTKEFIGKNDGQGNVGSLSIIADFVPDQSSGRDLSEYQYNVQGPPRLVNLTNTIPITEIDYQVGIRFRDGTIVPLYLEPGETCEVKFGFFKKSLYDNDFTY